MRFSTALAALLCGSFGFDPSAQAQGTETRGGEAQASALPGPGPKQAIAGLHGFRAESRLVFPGQEDAGPQRLECCEMFPDRARWCLQPFADSSAGQRLLQYRYGQQAYEIPVAAAESVEILGVARLDQILNMELRHALFLFPDGYAWENTGQISRVDLGAVGTLVATLDEAGRPTSLSGLTATGEIRDSYKELVWQTIDGRSWPASASLYQAEGKVWDEQVLSVRTSPRFLDSFFVPPDRRMETQAQSVDTELVQAIQLRSAIRQRTALELPAKWTWEDVLARSAELASAASAKLAERSWTLEQAFYYELGEDGAPAALYLHVEGEVAADAKLPDGWESIPARPALSIFLPGVRRLGAVALESLRKAAGERGVKAKSPILRVPSSDPLGAMAQLALPIESGGLVSHR